MRANSAFADRPATPPPPSSININAAEIKIALSLSIHPSTMNVEVTLVVSTPPRDQDIEQLKQAAAQLTNRKSSITVNVSHADDRFHLTTRFTIKAIAQSKVVDKISQKFEFWIADLAGYQDKWITFP